MDQSYRKGSAGFRIFLCAVILLTAVAGFIALKNLKKPPVQTEARELPLLVEGVRIGYTNFPVQIQGYGEVRSRKVVVISAEVSGKVMNTHQNLEIGGVIPEGEVLIGLDDRDYKLELETAASRLQTLKRDLVLAEKEYDRLKSLYEKNKTGSLSSVEKAESAVNGIADRITQATQALESAKLRLERSVIKAPFTCRITELSVEQGEYVTPGKKLMTLTDDSELEVIVSLDSRDVINWVDFNQQLDGVTGWFAPLKGKECNVQWTENNQVSAKATVDRIARYDSKTRTIHVAVRLEQQKNTTLVAGMFARVTIPGRTLEEVVVLPRHAVSFDNTVYVADENRLKTRSVTVARIEKEQTVVSSGLHPGEFVITTRLEQPLENSLLKIANQDQDSK